MEYISESVESFLRAGVGVGVGVTKSQETGVGVRVANFLETDVGVWLRVASKVI